MIGILSANKAIEITILKYSTILALGLDFYKPAKGAGMIGILLKDFRGFQEVLYCFVNVNKALNESWDYKD
jgi:hypothetical protein